MKFIAALCMLIDHKGLVFFPTDIRWRMIGRLAMPIFAYGVARGAFYTSSLKRYMKKMLLFSFISQIPFWGVQHLGMGEAIFSLNLNIGFTFLLALTAILLFKQYKVETIENYQKKSGKQIIYATGIIGCILLADFLRCDYGSYGVLIVLMGYIFYEQNNSLVKTAMGYMALTFLFYRYNMNLCILQSIGVLAYAVIYATKELSEKRIGRFFYWFYPVHLYIIACIKWWQMKG